MASAQYELIETRLPTTLRAHVKRLRRDGLGWRGVASNLHGHTGVPVSEASLRRWFPEITSTTSTPAPNSTRT